MKHRCPFDPEARLPYGPKCPDCGSRGAREPGREGRGAHESWCSYADAAEEPSREDLDDEPVSAMDAERDRVLHSPHPTVWLA